jgi:hypothetical protein
VGTGVCKYADTFGPATPNGVRGYIGPPADALQQPTNWYVRVGGSNNNGGSSASLTPERSGTDGDASFAGRFTSATAGFTSADVGKGLCLRTGANAWRVKVTGLISSTTVTINANNQPFGTGLTWALGGAWADLRAVVGDTAVTASAQGAVLSGDTVFIGAGTYRAVNVVTPSTGQGMFTPAFNGVVNIVGDVTGQYTGDAGMVQLTAYTTNDRTAPSATTLLNLNGKSNLAFSNIMFVGNNSNFIVTANTATSQNISFYDCAFLMPGPIGGVRGCITAVSAYGVPLNLVADRCVFVGGGTSNGWAVTLSLTTGVGSDYDSCVFVRNCNALFFGGSSANAFTVGAVGTAANRGNGLRIMNCFILGNGGLNVVSANNSTIFPSQIVNCFIMAGGGNALTAVTLGQIIEDYNLIVSGAPRTNVNTGAHSISDGSYAPLFHFGQERIWGGLLRPFGEPMAGSPLLGFGSDGRQTAYDLYNRPRPAGGGSLPYPAVGALERGNTPTQATSPAPPVGTYDWQFTGPGYQEFLLPVDTTATVISIKVQRDSAYSAPSRRGLPAMQILANGRLGIPAQTIVDTGASGTWNTLTAASFTPTATGWVTVRIASYDGTGVSVVSFANLSVT